MKKLLAYNDAVLASQEFITSKSKSIELRWIFREQIFQPNQSRMYIHLPKNGRMQHLAEKAYNHGRKRNIVEMKVIAYLEELSVVTVWYPQTDRDIPQGWDHGLKFSIRMNMSQVKIICSNLQWKFYELVPAYRRYQKYESFILPARSIQ